MLFHEIPEHWIMMKPKLRQIVEDLDELYSQLPNSHELSIKRGVFAMEQNDVFKYCLRSFDYSIFSYIIVSDEEKSIAGEQYIIWYCNKPFLEGELLLVNNLEQLKDLRLKFISIPYDESYYTRNKLGVGFHF